MSGWLDYSGKEPNEFAKDVIAALRAEGFEVEPTPRKTYGKSMTVRITWRGIYVGQMREDLWENDFACLNRFPHRTRRSVAKAPVGFDKNVFARERHCDPGMLEVHADGSGSYLWVRDKTTALGLMRDWARTIDETFFGHTDDVGEQQLENDVRSILQDESKSPTERLAEVAVRLGQGKFRTDLEQEFGTTCAVTGLTIAPVLRASHIVPWRTASHDERRDPNNGLLLSANVDALFDRYLISFRPDGEVMYSSFLNGHDKRNLGPIGNLRVPPSELRAGYLRRHNEAFENLERERRRYAGTAD